MKTARAIRYYEPYDNELGSIKKTYVLSDGKLVHPNTKRWLNTIYTDRHNDIFPGVKQDSIDFKKKKVAAFKKYYEMFNDVKRNEDLVNFGNGLVDWTNTYDILPLPIENVEPFRKQINLSEPSEDYKKAYKWMIEECFKRGEYRSVYVNGKSQSGAPFFIKDRDYRVEVAKHLIENLDDAVDCLMMGDYDDLVNGYHALPLFTDGIRVQADNVKVKSLDDISTKTRSYPNLQWLKSDGRQGDIINYTAKQEIIDGIPIFQGRTRKMYAYSSPLNHALGALHNYLYAGYEDLVVIAQYNGPKSVIGRISRKLDESGKKELFSNYLELVSLDKSSFDMTMSPSLTRIELDVIRANCSEELGDLYEVSTVSPTLIRSYLKGESHLIMSKSLVSGLDMINHSTGLNSLQSGHAFVSLKGKWKGVADIADKLIRFIKSYPEENNFIKRYSNKEYIELFKLIIFDEIPGFTVFTFGDDTMVASWIPGFTDYFRDFVENDKGKVHDDQLEEYALFLGYYYTPDLKYHKNIGKLIETLNGDERGYKSKSFPELGLYSRILEYRMAENPYVDDVLKVEELAYMDIGFDFKMYRSKGQLDFEWSVPNAEFVNKPEIIHYKYSKQDIDPKLFKEVYETIDEDFLYNNLRYHIGG